jgi:hypothetical protein
MAVVTEPPYLQRDVACVAAAFFASCCIRHTELSNLHSNDTRDDLRTVSVFTLCISLEEVQVLSHFQTSAVEFYIFSFSGKFYRMFHGCSRL